MNKTAIEIPTIHLNGTSRNELYEQVTSAGQAVQEAIHKLAEAAPHGRDYYVVPAGDLKFDRAQEQHFARIAKLQEVYDELETIYQGLANQESKR